MTRYEKIKNALDEMSTPDIIDLQNNYCEETNNLDDIIYQMYDFDELMRGQAPWEIVRCAYFGKHFNPCDDYFRFNGYANLESFDYAPGGNSGVYTSDIAKYIDANDDALNNDELQTILDEDEGEG